MRLMDDPELLAKAKEQGLATLNGLGMLMYQALIADQIYLKKEFDMKPIYETVSKAVRASTWYLPSKLQSASILPASTSAVPALAIISRV